MKYPFWLRLTVLPVALAVCCVLWIIIGMFSVERLGRVMMKTGFNLINKS